MSRPGQATSQGSAAAAATGASPARPDRSAALLAAEARLKGQSNPATTSSPSPTPPPPREETWTAPTDKQERELRMQFARALDRGIVRDNNYQKSATCVETLLKIANNILEHHDEPKYRSLRATNSMLKNQVLAAKGGHEYLILLGFRTQTTNFEQHFVIQPTPKRMHELRVGADVLSEHLAKLQERVVQSNASMISSKEQEAHRRARALAEADEDREAMRRKVARDKENRERRAAAERQQAVDEAEHEAEDTAAAVERGEISPAQLEAVRVRRELAIQAKAQHDASHSASAPPSEENSNSVDNDSEQPAPTGESAPTQEQAGPHEDDSSDDEDHGPPPLPSLNGVNVSMVSPNMMDQLIGMAANPGRGHRSGRDHRPRRREHNWGEGQRLG